MLTSLSITRYLSKNLFINTKRSINTSLALLNNNATTESNEQQEKKEEKSKEPQNLENELKTLLEKHKKCESDLADFKVILRSFN